MSNNRDIFGFSNCIFGTCKISPKLMKLSFESSIRKPECPGVCPGKSKNKDTL